MSDTIVLPVSTDPGDHYQIMVQRAVDLVPGIVIADGSRLALLFDAVSQVTAGLSLDAAQVATAIVVYLGRTVFGVPPVDATPAVATATITATDAAGHTILAGTPLELTALDGSQLAFTVASDVTIAALDTTTGVGEVVLVAVDAGVAGNGAAGPAMPASTITWVNGVTIETATTGGADAETIDEYLVRLRRTREAEDPWVTADGAAEQARLVAGVGRARGIRVYDPGPPADPAAGGHVTVFITDPAGEPADSGVKATVLACLDDTRIANETPHVEDPDYHTAAVLVTATCYPAYDPATVKANVEQAILLFLSPATWGVPPTGDQDGWIDEPKILIDDLIHVVKAVEGVHHITTLTLDAGTADVTLPTPVGLPDAASTCTATITIG